MNICSYVAVRARPETCRPVPEPASAFSDIEVRFGTFDMLAVPHAGPRVEI